MSIKIFEMTNSKLMDIINILIQVFIAFGTVAVAVLAVWGDYVRYKLYPPKLDIQIHHEQIGEFGQEHKKTIYYHLKVVNERTAIVKDCRVILKELQRIRSSKFIEYIPLIVDTSFFWSPSDSTPAQIEISYEQVFDFIRLTEGDAYMIPCLTRFFFNYDLNIYPNEIVRVKLVILASGYKALREQIFELHWNGKWSNEVEEMRTNVLISKL